MNYETLVPCAVLSLMDMLRSRGISSWLVGGSLRDILRGKSPQDWDLAVGCTPEELVSHLPDAIPTGLRYGTVTLCRDGWALELTCCRREGRYEDGRHPAELAYTRDIHADLARRDFTAGALAWNPEEGLLDPFGGREDIAARCLRAVGDPVKRLREDALRVLRALRFAATLGFTVEEKLERALRAEYRALRRISPERVGTELRKLLIGPWAEPTLEAYKEVLHALLPGVRPAGVGRCRGDGTVRLAWLLCSLSKAEALARLETLCPSRKERERVADMLTCHSLYNDPPALLTALGPEGAADVRHFYGQDTAPLERLMEEGFVWHTSLLAVGGGEAMAAGIPPGPSLGKALRRLREQVAEGRLPNEREALTAELRRMAGKADARE